MSLFELFVPLLGGGKRMIAVAHGKHKRTVAIIQLVALGDYPVVFRFAYKIALDVSALLHKLEIVQLLHFGGFSAERLDNISLCVVNQYHNVRQFHLRRPAHLDSRGNTLGDGRLGRSDRRITALVIIVLFKVNLAYKTFPNPAVRLSASDINKCVLVLLKHSAVQIIGHGFVDFCNTLVCVVAGKINFG